MLFCCGVLLWNSMCCCCVAIVEIDAALSDKQEEPKSRKKRGEGFKTNDKLRNAGLQLKPSCLDARHSAQTHQWGTANNAGCSVAPRYLLIREWPLSTIQEHYSSII
jgi:hypothetical protein